MDQHSTLFPQHAQPCIAERLQSWRVLHQAARQRSAGTGHTALRSACLIQETNDGACFLLATASVHVVRGGRKQQMTARHRLNDKSAYLHDRLQQAGTALAAATASAHGILESAAGSDLSHVRVCECRDTKMGARHAMCPCSLASPCKTLAQGQGPFAPSGTSRIFPEGKQQCSKGTLVSEEYTNTDVSDLGQDTMEVAQNF
eukprot:1158269-Pelagomonas_calceolata.AAC.25